MLRAATTSPNGLHQLGCTDPTNLYSVGQQCLVPTGFAIQRVNLSVSYYVNHTRCICFIIGESRSAAYSRPIWNKLVLESQAIADADNRKSVTQSSQTAHLPNVIICRLTVTCFAVCKSDTCVIIIRSELPDSDRATKCLILSRRHCRSRVYKLYSKSECVRIFSNEFEVSNLLLGNFKFIGEIMQDTSRLRNWNSHRFND